MEPARIGRYELHTPLGRGGMGTVYKARDPLMERWVAIKTITVHDAHQRARFQQEVQAAGSLNHPHITTIYDVGEQGDLAFIVMELVEGDTLASRLAIPVPWPEAIKLLLPICDALSYAHRKGVIHRDVKPANILISTEGKVKLTDFGVARLEAALRRITESGSTVGTPLYTAPEQLRNEPVDGRADLFSIGIVLFELVTSQHPFTAETLAQVIYRITQPEPANMARLAAMAPPMLVEVVRRALSKEAAGRFSDARALATALIKCLEQPDAIVPVFPAAAEPLTPAPDRPILDPVSNISLSPTEEGLLRLAFPGHDRIYLEREFSSGYSQARVLLATPVRSGGRRLAQVVLKLATPAVIDKEWRAYQEYVKDTLPPVTARILEEPLLAMDGQLALLRYSFAGGFGNAPPEALRAYYAQHNGDEVAELLDKSVFRAFGPKWWLQRKTTDLIIRREYDRLLPVHLVVEYRELAEATATPRNLIAGKANAESCRQLAAGQLVQIEGFAVEEISPDEHELTLQALPPSGNPTNPIRVRVVGSFFSPAKYPVGQTLPALIGVIVATRHELLRQLAEPAFPGQNLDQKQLTIGGHVYLNPLYDYESLLDQRLAVMNSIIHGDLNLDNILVTPASGLAWLIDFATTREGHNLYDFMRLETQVITKLLPQTRAGPGTVVQLMVALHQVDPSPQTVPAELRKPFTVLVAIRHMVRICQYSRENWDEYYLGLVITLLGALKFKELDVRTRALTLTAAATVRGLIANPALRLTPLPVAPPTPVIPPTSARSKLAAGVIGLIVILALLTALVFWLMGTSPPAPTATPTPARSPTPVAAMVEPQVKTRLNSPTPLPTPTSLPTATPTSTPSPTLKPIPQPEVVPTDTPVPTITPTPTMPTPTPTFTPSPTPCRAATYFDDLATDYPALGCPLEAWLSDFTYQQFERGLMIWRKSPAPAKIFVLYNGGNWRSEIDPQGPRQPSCPEAGQTGGKGPILSFGLIWCQQEMARLGLPLTGESAAEDSAVEEFEQGMAFRLAQTRYVLLADNSWFSLAEAVTLASNPEPTPAPASDNNVVLENFEGYNPSSLAQSYTRNTAWDKNELTLAVVTLADLPEPGQAARLVYTIKATPPDHYVGLERNLADPQDWSNAAAIQFWVRNEASAVDLVFQWGEQQALDGEVWQARLPLQLGETRQVKLPLTAQYFSRTDWSTAGNGQLDLVGVDYYAFFIERAQPGKGTLYIDSLKLFLPQAEPPAPPVCQGQPAPEFGILWQAYQIELGCPAGGFQILPFHVEETFEGGHLFWREDTNEVYLIYDRQKDGADLNNGNWELPPWKWDGVTGCNIGQSPPAGLRTPERGFGWLWCTHLGGPAGPLGWALTKEQGFNSVGRVQRFERGLAFQSADAKRYALLNNGRFLIEPPVPAQPAPPPTPEPPKFTPTGFEPAPVFARLWETLEQGDGPLGYPLGSAITDRNYARQPFERGFMFWWESPQEPQPIWVIYTPDRTANQGTTWSRYENKWVSGQPDFPPACPDSGPPLGPKSGFGVAWCYEVGVRDLLGWPLDAEFGSGNVYPKGAVQYFQGGVMFENPADRQVWALIDDSRWYRLNY